MIRALSDNEIRELLEKECYGHLACCLEDGRPYLVPITYVYQENALYIFSFEGQKIEAMRKNPTVCVQVQHVHEPERWRSALLWGAYEELAGEEHVRAFSLILERLWRESSRDHSLFLPFRNSAKTLQAAESEEGVVLYRVNITESSGRMEEYE